MIYGTGEQMKQQYKTSIALDKDLLETARNLRINISKACEEGLRKEVHDYQRYQEMKKKQD